MNKFIVLVVFVSVMCSANGITNDHKESSLLVNPAGNGKKDMKTEDARDSRDPAPEFYRGSSTASTFERDRYNDNRQTDRFSIGNDNNFVTSPGGTRFISSLNNNDRNRIGSSTYNSVYGSPYGTSLSNYGSSTGTRYGGTGYGTSVYGSNTLGGSNYGSTTGSGMSYLPGGVYDSNQNGLGWSSHGYQFPGLHEDDKWSMTMGHGKELTKKLLIPIAGAALLGVAAALITNPVLLHLGVAQGKRKRRDIEHAQNLAYKRYDGPKN